jgi:glutamate synthase (NADPH/NADH) small chain
MPDPTGFLTTHRQLPPRRPVPIRLLDWHEVYTEATDDVIRAQAGRCMDCGIPFCHHACPLGNHIPDWNDLVRSGDFAGALDELHATNNFPEFTGRLCPAPCEPACVLAIPSAGADAAPVTIKQVEVEIINRGYAAGAVRPQPATATTGRTVAVVGSGPAGLAAAQQLARAGHAVTVYERDDRPGGLLRFGIPDFKLEKSHVDRRLAQLASEGVDFRTGVDVGRDITVAHLRVEYDAVLLACGALDGRDVPDTPGRHLDGIHLAMAHLVASNRLVAGDADATPIDANGKHVVIIGGGDTAADCLGVAHRQGAASVTQLDIYPLPPDDRDAGRDPWPTWPWVLRSYPAHEEGGERVFAVAVDEFVAADTDAGRLGGVRVTEVTVARRDGRRVVTPVPGTERVLRADLVLLAIGFGGTDAWSIVDELNLSRTLAGGVSADDTWQVIGSGHAGLGQAGAAQVCAARVGAEQAGSAEHVDGVFVAGDMHRGASLIVWAIAEGRAVAAAIHAYFGAADELPAPVTPSSAAMTAARLATR